MTQVQQMVAAHTKRCAELKEAQHRANVRVDELESVNAQMRRERDEAVRRQAEADQALSQVGPVSSRNVFSLNT
jgi:septal ring factor EnvC (AmiA/AmiB activator)